MPQGIGTATGERKDGTDPILTSPAIVGAPQIIMDDGVGLDVLPDWGNEVVGLRPAPRRTRRIGQVDPTQGRGQGHYPRIQAHHPQVPRPRTHLTVLGESAAIGISQDPGRIRVERGAKEEGRNQGLKGRNDVPSRNRRLMLLVSTMGGLIWRHSTSGPMKLIPGSE